MAFMGLLLIFTYFNCRKNFGREKEGILWEIRYGAVEK
jgi:hypothetical protein